MIFADRHRETGASGRSVRRTGRRFAAFSACAAPSCAGTRQTRVIAMGLVTSARRAAAAAAIALTVLGPVAPSAATGRATPEALIEAMREGGTVVFLRHAATDEGEVDTGRLHDRAGQRNLSEAGIDQARALGRAFRALGIPFVRVLASPVFRARDTTELAFGADDVEVTTDLVADDYAGGELRRMLTSTGRLLATPPPEDTNVLLVSHRTPLEMVTGRPFPEGVLPEGAMAVFKPDGDGTRLLGTLSVDELIDAAGQSGGDGARSGRRCEARDDPAPHPPNTAPECARERCAGSLSGLRA